MICILYIILLTIIQLLFINNIFKDMYIFYKFIHFLYNICKRRCFMTEQELEEATQRILATLIPREQQILAMRFGIKGEEVDVHIQEIGQRFEATRKRVREIEEKALRRFKK